MDNIIFRRDNDAVDEPKKVPRSKIFDRKRKDLTPFISLFSEDEKLKLIRNLFERDAHNFNVFMSELNVKQTWPDAYLLMDTELKKRKIDILSSQAKSLTDRIYQVFFPEDISID